MNPHETISVLNPHKPRRAAIKTWRNNVTLYCNRFAMVSVTHKDQDVVFSIAKSCNRKLVENTVYSTPAGAAATHLPGHRLGEDRREHTFRDRFTVSGIKLKGEWLLRKFISVRSTPSYCASAAADLASHTSTPDQAAKRIRGPEDSSRAYSL